MRAKLFVGAIAAALVAALLVVTPRPAEASATLPAGFVEDVIATGLTYPTAMAHLPDGRILVLEKDGAIRVIKNGALLPTPFADLSAEVNNYWDRGLTGIAIDPSFATNGFIYLFYPFDSTGNDGSGPVTNRLVRVTASGDTMVAGSETVILGTVSGAGCASVSSTCMPQDWYGHAPDSIRFASDGTMFVSMGDASSWDYVDDRALRSQDIDQYPGKILHITKAGLGLSSNPFFNGDATAIRSKVWAYGLRNPFRLHLQPGTDVPYVGDVGWDTVEEIDIATPGANFGWPCYEGSAPQPGYQSKPVCQTLYAKGAGAVKNAAISWNHNGTGAAAVGGPFTPTTSSFPAAYQGGFFYGDYAQSWIKFAKVDSNGNVVGTPTSFATAADGPVDLSFGADGNLYYVAINSGEVRRIRPTGSAQPTTTFLSDLTPTVTPTNGWGPYERDKSNGEQAAGDGKTLTINTATYAKGLGIHAASDIRYTVPSGCTLNAQVGVDDEVPSPNGSVVFEVWNGTTTRLYQSPKKTGADAATAVSVPLGSVTNLRLVVTTAGDGDAYDHGDWGDAKIVCPAADSNPPVLSGIGAAPSTTSAVVSWTTDEASTSQVDYGPTTTYGSSTALDSTKVTSHSQTITGLTAGTLYHYRVRSADAAGNSATSTDRTFTTTSTGSTVTYLSDLTPTSTPTNGWGPYERDKSNGEQLAGDGTTLTINGATYAKGLGVHAASDVRYTVPSSCTFSAQVGVDDEVPSPNGSVVFEVWNGTTTRLYQSGTKTGADPATAVSVPLGTVTNLRLVVTATPDGNVYDHADWGDAKVTCGSTGNGAPVPTITSPTSTQTFKVDDLVQLTGSATDPEDGTIPDSGLTWQVVLRHCPGGVCHMHPFATFNGPSATFRAPDHGDDSYLEVNLLATDSAGQTTTATTTMLPQTVKLNLATSPAGLQVIYGGQALSTPAQITTIVGGTRTVDVVSPQGNSTWSSWSDNGTQQHAIVVPATDSTLTATFTQTQGPSTTYVSDLTPSTTPTNGWGPYERDKSNGEQAAGDGTTLTINGTTYAKGLGTNATADIRYTVPAGCTTFTAQVGVDDEVPTTNGTIVFEVWNGTTTRLYQSVTKTGAAAASAVSVPLAGVTTLRLLTTPTADGNVYDHGDWGDAKLSCSSGGDVTPPVISAVNAAPSTTSALVTWTTDEGSTSQVEYGTTTSYGSSTANDTTLVTSHSQTVSGLAASTLYHYRVKSTDAFGNQRISPDATFTTNAAPAGTVSYLSDLVPTSATNGWGPYERDRSNGGQAVADGVTLKINGTTYAKGLGTNSTADLRYTIPSSCSFTAQVGIDDEVTAGTVIFEVWNGTTTKLYSSPTKTSTDGPTSVSVSLTGVTNLRLVSNATADGTASDHADWGDAKVTCTTPASLFGTPTSFTTGPHAHAAAIQDLNGDGKNDVVSVSAGNNSLNVLLGNGAGGLSLTGTYTTGTEPKSIALGDLNGDGKLDAVTGNQITNDVSVFLGNGNGTFQAKVDYPAAAGSHETALADLNGDSKLDIASVGWGGSALSILIGNGNGTFQAKVDYATGSAPSSVTVADFNKDGKLDVATANNTAANVSVLLGNGNGTFGAAVNKAVGAGPHSIRSADLNGDGNIDLAVVSDTANTVSVLLGTATGAFANAVSYATSATPKGIAIADINGDGKLDILAATINGNYPNLVNPGGNFISILLGNGNGTFQAKTDYWAGQAPFCIAVGMLDGDTKPDIVSTSWYDNGVQVRLHT